MIGDISNRKRGNSADFDVHPGSYGTTFSAFANLTKAIVGAGSFALPWAFANMGLWGGLITICVTAMLSSLTIFMVIRVRHAVYKRTRNSDITYVDCARYCFGSAGAGVAYACTIAASLGVCGAYLNFVGSNLSSLAPQLTRVEWQGVVVPLVLLLSVFARMEHLALTSVLGDVALVVGMVATMWRGGEVWDGFHPESVPAFSMDTYGRSFGSVAFLFAVNFLIFPIERSMRHRRDFKEAVGYSFIFVSFTNAAFGFFGLLMFGVDVCSIVTLNLKHSLFIVVVKLALCLDLTASYPVVLAAGRELLEKLVFPDAAGDGGWTSASSGKRGALRVAMVGVTFCISIIPGFGFLTNLVGGVAMCTLSFVMPPLMMLRLHQVTKQEANSQLETPLVLPEDESVQGGGDKPNADEDSSLFSYTPRVRLGVVMRVLCVLICISGIAAVSITTRSSIIQAAHPAPVAAICKQ